MAGGRPTKYDPKNNKAIYSMALLGATDKEIASFLEVSEQTVNGWKIEYPEFLESLKKGKELADQRAAKSLFKRAIGFHYDEVTTEQIDIKIPGAEGKKVLQPATLTKTVRKLVIPDTTAQIFWLKNRQSKKWRDKQDIGVEVQKGQIFKIGGQTIEF